MFWCAAQLPAQREHLALKFLALNGYETYFPRLREHRMKRGRKIEVAPPLFPSYAFVLIQLQWHTARWCAGVIGLITQGDGTPSKVPDQIVNDLRARERGGLIDLPKPRRLTIGDPMRVLGGPFEGHLALYQGMKPRQRVEVLLSLLGAQQRVILPKADVAWPA
jgi:transcriptional antiterminator RfaH